MFIPDSRIAFHNKQRRIKIQNNKAPFVHNSPFNFIKRDYNCALNVFFRPSLPMLIEQIVFYLSKIQQNKKIRVKILTVRPLVSSIFLIVHFLVHPNFDLLSFLLALFEARRVAQITTEMIGDNILLYRKRDSSKSCISLLSNTNLSTKLKCW